jgi:XTP/dITP diphosphohydrolase
MRELLIATHNQGKVAEFADILLEPGLKLLSLADIGLTQEVQETGSTFAENAVLKAEAYARESGLLTLADDSGLEVDALSGRPGVLTARFGGPGLTAEQRYRYLLTELRDVPVEKRTARFRCVVALADREQLLGTAAGVCEGRIAFVPAGNGGFGYDPVFYLPERGQTMAQLSPVEKQRLSHRGRAAQAILPLLHACLSGDASA